ncbi:hypothetical protein Sta7437_4262 [Stanieria cyanosphaera PCC 7437]|uniref:Uncharacterized protein n=1 Tax=Stanieria cyanosphaera (strain ATCC 29371 / PCC 7437) TaxID=111780 RepID=K9XYQ5_STAC7|nr:hypothetical protein [Stanieria cyanosphaera]AFZ37735.1 hypothetical protein Sta7437_4262 [Stanieria cyanosphaera PCC 7437]
MFSSLKALLGTIVDYAGLFPPAKLTLRDAIALYARYLQTSDQWMLGRFVLPLSQLQDLEKLVTDVNTIVNHWLLSVILSENWELELKQIQAFNYRNKIQIASVEFPILSPEEISRAIFLIPNEIESFFEIPLSENLETYLSVLKGTKASAKIRTGGLNVKAFPSVEQLCRFIFASAEVQVPFKATAGLHHALPGKYPVSYEPDSLSVAMQGFINVTLLAALVYWQKITQQEAVLVLQESSSESFQFQEDHITWNDKQLTTSEIKQSRQLFYRSFGSCSFQEPLDELESLSLT